MALMSLFLVFYPTLLSQAAFTGYLTVFPLLIAQRYGMGALEIGLFFTYVSVTFISIQMKFFAALVKRFGKHCVGMVGSVLYGIGLMLLPVATIPDDQVVGTVLICCSLFFVGLGYALLNPSIPSLISRYADPKNMGGAIGTAGGCSYLISYLINAELYVSCDCDTESKQPQLGLNMTSGQMTHPLEKCSNSLL